MLSYIQINVLPESTFVNPIMKKYYTNISLNDLDAVANEILNLGKKIIILTGDLGAGKTALAKRIVCGALGYEIDVPSPTFNIAHVYPSNIWHLDLYRIDDAHQLEEVGLSEALGSNLCIIEWPQIAKHMLPKGNVLEIEITYKDELTRDIVISCINL